MEGFVVEVHQDVFLFVWDQSYQLLHPFGEGSLFAVVVVGEVGVEVECYLLLA